jgi:DNA-binding LytR/AlgR family response regulator
MRVILVDDELPALDELSYQLNKFEQIEIIAQFTDSIAALKEIERLEPDAVFLDIDMPILNGLNLATELLEQDKSLPIIFITAYNHYALQAFEVNAIDYIVKPVRLSRLQQTVDKLQKRVGNNVAQNTQLMNQLNALKNTMNEVPDKLVVFDGDNYHFIQYGDIIYIEARIKVSEVVTTKGTFSTKKTMSVMEERLKDQGFFRCHRSYIINPKHITKIMPASNGTFQIKLIQSPVIPVSKPHALEVKKIIESME